MVQSKNNLHAMRKQAGLTQRALAELAGVSQPTVQRAEADDSGPSWEVACAIAAALGKPLEKVFPIFKRPGKRASAAEQEAFAARASSYLLKMKVAGIPEPFLFALSADQNERLYKIVQANEGYAVFPSEAWTVIVDLAEVQWTNFLWDPPFMGPSGGEEDHDSLVKIWFKGDAEPALFSAEADKAIPEEDDDELNVEGAFAFIEFELDVADDAGIAPTPLRFMDTDGEEVWFNPAQMSIMMYDRSLGDQRLIRAVNVGFDEEFSSTLPD